MAVTMVAAEREMDGGRRPALAACAAVLAVLLLSGAVDDSWAAHSYPRLVNIYFPSLGDADLELLSRWDVLVLAKRAEDRHQAELAELRTLNPDITLLAHMAVAYSRGYTDPPINAGLTAEIEANGWWMRDTAGGHVTFDGGSLLLNMTLECPTNGQGQRLCDWLPGYVAEQLYDGGRWDGLFLDYSVDGISWMDGWLEYPIDHDLDGFAADRAVLNESWRLGMRECVSKLRDLVGDDFLLVGNGNNTLYDLCDGDTREAFPYMHGDWYENMMNEEHGYLAFEALYRDPTTNIINYIWQGDVTPDGPVRGGEFDREFLLGLTSTLVFGSGYFSCDGPAHSEAWWIEYYDIDLGEPLGRAENVDVPEGTVPEWVEFTKIRRFENGIAVVNPARWSRDIPLGGAYYDIHSWNGQFYEFKGMRTSARVAYQSGEVLVGTGVVLAQKVGSARAVASRDAVAISWDPVDGATSYSIYRAKVDSTGSPGHRLLVSVVDELFYTDRDIVSASDYRYFIAPIDELRCEGQQSRAIEVSTEPGSDLSVALMVDEHDGLLALRWNPPVNSDPPLVSYELLRTEEGGSSSRLTEEPLDNTVTEYTDAAVEPGREYVYALVRRAGAVEETLAWARATAPAAIGHRTAFVGLRPQPASTATSVSFMLADAAPGDASATRLSVYDVAGRLVRRLVDGPLGPGQHVREWDLAGEGGEKVASGCYLFVLERGRERLTTKALVLR
ncbi:MAG: putative glycoside hydrolase [Candidatus Eisenbacteria bacterium]